MSGTGEVPPAPLLAIVLPRPAAAAAVLDAWAERRAVVVLDPDAPGSATAAALARVGPTQVLDADGERPWPGGAGVDPGVAAVVATSGTAATPRAVELTWAGLDASARAVTTALDVDPAHDRWIVALPLHAVAGLAILARAGTTGTAYRVLPDGTVDAIAAAAADPATRGTGIISLVATQLVRLLDAGAPLHQFRTVLLGGGPVPPGLRERAAAAGVDVHATYGMTETWGGCVHDGHALDGVDVRLAEHTNVIEIAGACVMRGYRDAPDATAAAFTSDGWYRTGDVGAWSAPDTLAVVDRMSDMVITGGVNVSPTAVEAVLGRHPAVADLAVIGRPDPEWGERVVACVVPRDPSAPPTLDGLRAFGRERLRAADLPRELVLVDTVPRTPGGKPRRRELRE